MSSKYEGIFNHAMSGAYLFYFGIVDSCSSSNCHSKPLINIAGSTIFIVGEFQIVAIQCDGIYKYFLLFKSWNVHNCNHL